MEQEHGEMKKSTITVCGVEFSADQVKSAVVTIDGRDIIISEKQLNTKLGF